MNKEILGISYEYEKDDAGGSKYLFDKRFNCIAILDIDGNIIEDYREKELFKNVK